MNNVLRLQAFRQALYEAFGPARDALFELCDAVLTTPSAASFAHLSLAPLFRRQWPSLYEAIEDARPDPLRLMRLTLNYADESAFSHTLARPLLVGDHTAWPRLSAKTLEDRSYEHHADRQTRIQDGLPITVGYGFSTMALVAEAEGSWVLPLMHERIASKQAALDLAADELREVAQALHRHTEARPIALFDSQYGCAPFLEITREVDVDLIVRLRSNRVLRSMPPPYRGHGRPFVHGPRFAMKDPTTWGEPTQEIEVQDPRLGRVRLRRWARLHFQEGSLREMSLILVECLDRVKKKPLWLAFVGLEEPPLETLWRLYLRRFLIEHWYRFAKGRLHWTLPRFSSPAQHERWSALLLPLMMQLYLARAAIGASALPWQKPQAASQRTPGRVAQGMAALIAVIGSPACAPKRRGKSPGWEAGRERAPRARHPVEKKRRKSRLKRRRRVA